MLEPQRPKVEKYVEAYTNDLQSNKGYPQQKERPQTFQVGDVILKTTKHIQ